MSDAFIVHIGKKELYVFTIIHYVEDTEFSTPVTP